MQNALRAVKKNRIRRFLQDACRLVKPLMEGTSQFQPSMGLENLENRQLLSATAVGQFLVGQQSGFQVSSTDLINGKAPWTGELNDYTATYEGGPISLLNDGSMSADKTNLNEASKAPDTTVTPAFPGNVVFDRDSSWQVAYSLVNGDPNTYTGNGYTLSEIDVYSGHPDNRNNQYFDISVLVKDQYGTSWVSLSELGGGFKYAPNLGGGAAKVVVKSAGGALATNALAIRFTSMGADDGTNPVNGAPGKATVWRELDVIGVPTTMPTTAPVVTGKAGSNKTRLDWAPIAQADHYSILRTTTGPNADDYYEIGQTTDPFYLDTGAWNDANFYYKVVAINGLGSSPASTPVTIMPKLNATAPAPTNIVAKGGLGAMNLTWTAEPFANSYNIYRATSQGGPFTLVNANPVTDTKYTDVGPTGGLANNTTYWYKVSSYTDDTSPNHEGTLSAAISGKTAMVGTGTGLVGMYYDDGGWAVNGSNPQVVDDARNFQGALYVRADAKIDIDFGNNAPMAGMGADNFSCKWVGQFQAPVTDYYTFYTLTDDGGSLTLDGQKLIVDPLYHGQTAGTDDKSSETLFPGGILLQAGQKYDIEMTQFEGGGGAGAHLYYQTSGIAKSIVPTSQLYQVVPTAVDTINTLAGPGGVLLNWSGTAAASFTVRRGVSPDDLKDVATVNTTTFLDQPLVNGQTYYYQIVAVDDAGSAASAVVSATPGLIAPNTPTAPSVGANASSAGGQIGVWGWSTVPFATGYNIYRSATAGGPYVKANTTPVTGNSFQDSGLQPNTPYYYVVTAVNEGGESAQSPEGTGSTNSLPAGWLQADIGNPGRAGRADYDASTGTFTVRGGGADIWDNGDQFHYLYMPFNSEGTATVRVVSMTNITDANAIAGWSKSGIMIRKQISTNTMHAFASMTPSNGPAFQGRPNDEQGYSFNENVGGLNAPYWVRLTRIGNEFTMEYSQDGQNWISHMQTRLVNMGTDVYIGLAVDAADNNRLTESKFDNLSISTFVSAPKLGLTSVSAAGGVSLAWATDPFATGWVIERSTSPDFAAGTVQSFSLEANKTTLTDNPGSATATYYYRALKTSKNGNSGYSAVLAVTPATKNVQVIGQGVAARQWNNTGRTGDPSLIRLESELDLNWGDGANNGKGTPSTLGSIGYREGISGQPVDNFATRFTGQITIPVAGTYTFLSRTDDDGYLWVNGTLVSADPGGHGLRDPNPADTTRTGNVLTPIYLDAGKYDFVFQHQEGGGGAGAVMDWIKPDGTRETVPSQYLSSVQNAPVAPQGLSTTSSGLGGFVGLSFTDASFTETSFVVQRAQDANFTNPYTYTINGNVAGVINGMVWTGDQGLMPDTDYFYRVAAVNPDGQSDWSNVAQVHTDATFSISGSGAAGHYYNTSNGNEPSYQSRGAVFGQLDSVIDFTSGTNAATVQNWLPFANYGGANAPMTVAWTGKVLADVDGTYTFVTNSDDASYLWVDGQLVSAGPGGHGEQDADPVARSSDVRKPITLTAGWHNFVMTYANGGGGFGAHLKWITPLSADQTKSEVIPSDHLDATSDLPAAATNVTYSALMTQRVTISWKDNATNEINYVVQRSTDANFAPETIVTVAQLPSANGGVQHVTDYGVRKSTNYYYRVLATNYDGSTPSETLTVGTPVIDVVPAAPSNLVAEARTNDKIKLTWQDNSDNEFNFSIERSTSPDSGFVEIATVGDSVNSYIDADAKLVLGTTYYYRVRASNNVGYSADYTNTASATTATTSLPTPWQQADIGPNPGVNPLPGDGNYSPSTGVWEVRGDGDDIWNAADAFHFVYMPVDSDATITARILTQGNTDAWAKAGVEIRNDLTPGSAHMLLGMVRAQNFVAFQGRQAANTGSIEVGPTAADAHYMVPDGPTWLRLVKTGSVISGYVSSDSTNGTDGTWFKFGTDTTAAIGGSYYIGLAVTSHNQSLVSTAEFDHVTVTKANTNVKQAKPSGVYAQGGAGEGLVTVTWQDNSDAETGFSIQRSTSMTGGFTDIGTAVPGATSFTDRGLNTSSTYYYRVVALNNRGTGLNSDPSDVSNGTLPATWPAAMNYPDFTNTAGWQINPAAAPAVDANGKNVLRITPMTNSMAGSAWATDRRDVTTFTSTFDFLFSSVTADGFTWSLQNNDLAALGTNGGGLGYQGIGKSIAIKFDVYPSSTTTGLYLNGAAPGEDAASIDMTPSGINFYSGHVMHAMLTYNGTTLTELVKDTVSGAIFRKDYTVNIPSYLGDTAGYVGFTGATGGAYVQTDIQSFTYSYQYTQPPAQLVVNGTTGNDVYYVKHDGTNLKVWNNATGTGTPAVTSPWDNTESLTINGLDGDDQVILDTTGGSLQPYGGIFINGGAGNNLVSLRGLPAATDLTVNGAANSTIKYGSETYNYTNATVQLGAASVGTTPSAVVLNSLKLTGTAKVAMSAANASGSWGKHQVLDLKSLDIADTAQLDLNDNDMILRHTDGDFGVTKTKAVTSLVNKAFSTGSDAWLGNGLTSSAAYNDYNVGDMVTNLAIFNNDDGTGFAWYDTFDGQAVDNMAVLVKYTMYGDTDIDGVITGSDFAAATGGWFDSQANKPVTYMTGDFNYDGKVTADDFALITSSWFVSTRADHAAKPMAAEQTPTEVFDAPIVASAPTAEVAVATTSPFATTTQKSDKVFLTDDIAVLA